MQITDILAQKQTQLTDQSHRVNSNRSNGYRTVAGYTQNLPDWLAPYAQNACWQRRLANLLKEGYEKELRYFVENKMTDKIVKVFNYFNTAWSKDNFLKTVEGIRKELTNLQVVYDVCKRLMIRDDQLRAIKGIVYRWGEGCLRYAVRAQEEGRDKFKYFCWLTSAVGQKIMKESNNIV